MNKIAWLPYADAAEAAEKLGGIPEGVTVVPFLDVANLPGDPAEVNFLVAPYLTGSASLDRAAEMTNLEVVQTQTAGYEDMLPKVPAGVRLANAPGVHDTATAELAVGLAIAQSRGIDEDARAQLTGTWNQRRSFSVADRRILLIGVGNVGEAIAERFAVLEPASITQVGRTAREGVHAFTELDELLPQADIVILACPLNEQTHHLLDARALALLPDDALVVNVARGPVLDTEALLAEKGRIRAALDVTDPEPLPPDHPLWTAPRVLITPHVGGAADCFWPRRDAFLARSLRAWTAGETLPGEVNRPDPGR